MITDTDIGKLKKVFVTKEDLKENIKILVNEMISLFESTNKRIDKFIDKSGVLEDQLDDHENRIRNIENKIFVRA